MAEAKQPKPDTAEAKKPRKSPRKRAEELMAHIKDGKLVAKIFGETLEKQYLIYNKSISEWRVYFKARLPENPDTEQCKKAAAKLANLYHEATFYYSAAELQLEALQSGRAREFSTEFNKLIAEYKDIKERPPAAKTLEMMASGPCQDLEGAISNAKIIRNFWKRIMEDLTEQRKHLEIITRNNSIQSWHEPKGSGNIPAQIPKREEFGKG